MYSVYFCLFSSDIYFFGILSFFVCLLHTYFLCLFSYSFIYYFFFCLSSSEIFCYWILLHSIVYLCILLVSTFSLLYFFLLQIILSVVTEYFLSSFFIFFKIPSTHFEALFQAIFLWYLCCLVIFSVVLFDVSIKNSYFFP